MVTVCRTHGKRYGLDMRRGRPSDFSTAKRERFSGLATNAGKTTPTWIRPGTPCEATLVNGYAAVIVLRSSPTDPLRWVVCGPITEPVHDRDCGSLVTAEVNVMCLGPFTRQARLLNLPVGFGQSTVHAALWHAIRSPGERWDFNAIVGTTMFPPDPIVWIEKEK